MAQHNVTSIVQDLISLGTTWAEIEAVVGGYEDKGSFYISGRKAESALLDMLDAARQRAARSTARTAGATGPLATTRQVDLILTLLQRRRRNGDGDGFLVGMPTTRQAISALSRREASSYIDSLSGTY